MDKLIQRINELAAKKRSVGLTPEEQAEQKELYKEYLKRFRSNMERQLDNTDVEFPDGRVLPFKQAGKKKE